MPPVAGVYRNPGRWRAVIHQQEIRHSSAGCLLSVVLFAPLLVPSCGVGPVAALSLLYAAVLVPTLAGYYSLTAVVARSYRFLTRRSQQHGPSCARFSLGHTNFNSITNFFQTTFSVTTLVVTQLFSLFSTLLSLLLILPNVIFEFLLLAGRAILFLPVCLLAWSQELQGALVGACLVRVTLNQLVFLLLLEHLLLPAVQLLLSLYHLLAYNVILYIYSAWRGNSPPRGVQRLPPPSYATGTGWFMAARLGKAAVLSTLMSVAGHRYLQASAAYTIAAALYLAASHCCLAEDGVYLRWLRKFRILSASEEEEEEDDGDCLVSPALRALPVIASITLICITVTSALLTLFSNSSLHSDNKVSSYSNFSTICCYVLQHLQEILAYVQSSFTPESSVYARFRPTSMGAIRVSETSSGTAGYGVCATVSRDAVVFESFQQKSESWMTARWLLLVVVAIYTNVVVPSIFLRKCYSTDNMSGQPLFRFKKATKQACSRQESCPVCLERLVRARVTVCGHVYHTRCLRDLINSRHTRCPLCNTTL